MMHINTVLGPVHPEEIGLTGIHEHIMWGPPGWQYDAGSWFDITKVFEKCYHELIDFRLYGGRTYVDCSGIGPGRNLDIYVKLAQSSGLNIIASTGFGSEDYISPHFHKKERDYFEDLFVRELTEGMGQSRIKAGIIKVGNGGETFTELEELEYRAAARAAKRTGVAVITDGVRFALRQLEVLIDEKLDPSRIVISHLDTKGNVDLERDKQIARSGAYVAYDQVGIEDIWSESEGAMPDSSRVELVQAMLAEGFKDRILLSTTSNCWTLGHGERLLHNSAHLLRYFVPKLKEAGIPEKDITDMLIENPKRALPIQ